jgi:hypothetical protein
LKSLGLFPFLIFLSWLLFVLLCAIVRRRKKRALLKQVFREDLKEGLSLVNSDYIIDKRGRERSNPIERRFRRRYLFDLLEVFENRCAACKKEAIKFDLDHFFIPKSRGGNLMMRHKKGYWVCNALTLCHPCNQRKKDLAAQEFFEPHELEVLRQKIGLVSLRINDFHQVDE